MARLTSIPPFTGTVGPVTIYKRYDEYIMRSRSSLTAERVKTDPAFRKTMQYANLMGMASPIASTIYALLPKHRQKHELFRKLVGEVTTWLKYHWSKDDIIDYLSKQYADKQQPVEGAVTRLRVDYRARRAALNRNLRRQGHDDGTVHEATSLARSRSFEEQLRCSRRKRTGTPESTAPPRAPSFELRLWRKHDRLFRQQYFQTFKEFDWSKPLVEETS